MDVTMSMEEYLDLKGKAESYEELYEELSGEGAKLIISPERISEYHDGMNTVIVKKKDFNIY